VIIVPLYLPTVDKSEMSSTLIVKSVDLFLRPALKLIGIFPPKYKLFAFKSQSVDDILPDTENVSMLNVNVLSFILSCVKCCSPSLNRVSLIKKACL
jgi:hypothetical protein